MLVLSFSKMSQMQILRWVLALSQRKAFDGLKGKELFSRLCEVVAHSQVEKTDAALLALIENYCRAAGVRNLQKPIEKIYRKLSLDEKSYEKRKIDRLLIIKIALQLVRQGDRNEPMSKGVELVESTEGKAESGDEYAKHVSETDSSSSSDDNDNNSDGEADENYDQTPTGVVMGLAWTARGGSTLYIKTTQVQQGEGKGERDVFLYWWGMFLETKI